MSHTKTRFRKRPLSYSQLASWEWNKEEWYKRYILNEPFSPTPETDAGNRIGDMIGGENCPLGLAGEGIKEYQLSGEVDGIPLTGFIDIWNDTESRLHENKTSYNKSRWSQRKADEHGQLTMYALMLSDEGVLPSNIQMFLNFIPLRLVGVSYELFEPVKWRQYETRRTQGDVEAYKMYIVDTVRDMHEYVENYVAPPQPPCYSV